MASDTSGTSGGGAGEGGQTTYQFSDLVFQSQKTLDEDVVELAFRARSLELNNMIGRGEENENKAIAKSSGLFSSLSSRMGITKKVSRQDMVPSGSFLKVLMREKKLDVGNGKLEQNERSREDSEWSQSVWGPRLNRYQEIYRSEVQGCSRSPVYSTLLILPVSKLFHRPRSSSFDSDRLSEYLDGKTEAIDYAADTLVRVEIYVGTKLSMDPSKYSLFGTVEFSLQDLLKRSGLMDEDGDLIDEEERRGGNWERGWMMHPVLEKKRNSKRKRRLACELDIRIARPPRCVSTTVPLPSDLAPNLLALNKSSDVKRTNNVLRRHVPLPKELLRGAFSSPHSRAFTLPVTSNDPRKGGVKVEGIIPIAKNNSSESSTSSSAFGESMRARILGKMGMASIRQGHFSTRARQHSASTSEAKRQRARRKSFDKVIDFVEFREELVEIPLGLYVPHIYLEARSRELEESCEEWKSTVEAECKLAIENYQKYKADQQQLANVTNPYGSPSSPTNERQSVLQRHMDFGKACVERERALALEYQSASKTFLQMWDRVVLGHSDLARDGDEEEPDEEEMAEGDDEDDDEEEDRASIERKKGQNEDKDGTSRLKSVRLKNSKQTKSSSGSNSSTNGTSNKGASQTVVSFRPSNQRKNKRLRWLPVNLHLQVLAVSNITVFPEHQMSQRVGLMGKKKSSSSSSGTRRRSRMGSNLTSEDMRIGKTNRYSFSHGMNKFISGRLEATTKSARTSFSSAIVRRSSLWNKLGGMKNKAIMDNTFRGNRDSLSEIDWKIVGSPTQMPSAIGLADSPATLRSHGESMASAHGSPQIEVLAQKSLANRSMSTSSQVFSGNTRRLPRGSIRIVSSTSESESNDCGAPFPSEGENSGEDDPFSFYYDTITFGAPAAHHLGFEKGGLYELEPMVEQAEGEYKRISTRPGASVSQVLEAARKWHELHLQYIERRDIVYPQILSAVTSAIMSRLYVLAASAPSSSHTGQQESEEEEEEYLSLIKNGFLVGWESLLSSRGKELGMLEDAAAAANWITENVRVRIVTNVDPCVRVSMDRLINTQELGSRDKDGAEDDDDDQMELGEDPWLLTIHITKELLTRLPKVLQAYVIQSNATVYGYSKYSEEPGEGNAVDIARLKEHNALPLRITLLLFTQGINEMQSVACAWASATGGASWDSIQERINTNSVVALASFCARRFRTYAANSSSNANAAHGSRGTHHGVHGNSAKNAVLAAGDDDDAEIEHDRVLLAIAEKEFEPGVHDDIVASVPLKKQLSDKVLQIDTTNTTSETPSPTNQNPSIQSALQAQGQKAAFLLTQLKYAVRTQAASEKNLEILTISADLVRMLNGLRICSCKSAKDRTAMALTLEEARLLVGLHRLDQDVLLPAANLLREQGVRLINVHKNTGQQKYAFNALQRKMLPFEYRPPPSTIGGLFRKGVQS